MPQIKYVGPFDEVEIPALGVVVKRGDAFDATGDVGKNLLAQSENYEAVKTTTKKES